MGEWRRVTWLPAFAEELHRTLTAISSSRAEQVVLYDYVIEVLRMLDGGIPSSLTPTFLEEESRKRNENMFVVEVPNTTLSLIFALTEEGDVVPLTCREPA